MTFKSGPRPRVPVVKRVPTLAREVAQASDGPYERQPIAQKAPASRRRVIGLLGVGLLLLLIEAAFARGGFPLVAAIYLVACGALLHRQRLGGIIATTFAALLAIALPLGLLKTAGALDAGDYIRGAVSIVLGLAALPDLVTLVRDAELQYAYGRWALRDG